MNFQNTESAKEKEAELFKRIAAGDIQVRNEMIEKNMGLVYKEARRYLGRGLEYEDLVQEGCIGLMRAIEKFDYRKECKFSTYATWWIRQAMTRAIGNYGRHIRLPIHLDNEVNKIKVTRENFYLIYGRMPTNEELAKILNTSVKHIEYIINYNFEEGSLDIPIGEDEYKTSTLGEFIIDENENVEEETINKIMTEKIEKVLDKLTPREKKIIKMRMGLYGDTYLLKDIAKIYGLSVERIRQIEEKAKKRLKYGKLHKELKELIKV